MLPAVQRCWQRAGISIACRSRCSPRLGSPPCSRAAIAPGTRPPGGGAFIDAAFARRRCHRVHGGVAVTAEPGGLASALADAAVDAVVVVGGTGSGRNDATVHTLASVGEVHVHGIALLPGETTALGAVGARPVLALPGRLDAALAAWHLLGQVMLARLAGSREAPRLWPATLTHKVSSTVGLSELVPVRCEGGFATPIASGYVPLSALAPANGWILIAPASEGYPAHRGAIDLGQHVRAKIRSARSHRRVRRAARREQFLEVVSAEERAEQTHRSVAAAHETINPAAQGACAHDVTRDRCAADRAKISMASRCARPTPGCGDIARAGYSGGEVIVCGAHRHWKCRGLAHDCAGGMVRVAPPWS